MKKDENLVFEVLKESFYFQGLKENLLREIVTLARIKSYEKGEEVFGEGERALGFFIILEGHIKIYKLSSKGKEQIIHLLGRGEVFAEIVLSGAETYPAYAQALSPSKLAFFERTSFLKLIQKRPELALNLLGLFSLKLKKLLNTIENLTLREAGERLLLYLWELSEEGRKKEIKLSFNKGHLALLLGITPETLSRLFQKYKEEGLFIMDQKKIFFLNLEKFKNYVLSTTL